ncbi:MAG: helix-turn-helix domain-containing protein [Spirochaetales bacterium]|jgi:transcriptional regulator with XRE-family HTH domain|nr:helix-turn-helix domain-containing protein [Spirochaetales bacterium]
MTERDLRSILSRNIKRYRTVRNLSQAALAEKLNMSINFLANIEGGRRWVSPLTLVKFATALKIEPYELFMPEITLPPNASIILDEAISEVTQTLNKIRNRYL